MEAIRSSETSVEPKKSTRAHIPEDGILQLLLHLDRRVELLILSLSVWGGPESLGVFISSP
jgi:hypothetical protein